MNGPTAPADGAGVNTVDVKLSAGSPPLPRAYSASASVMDVNRQAWGDTSSFIAHPADRYVGIKIEKYFTDPGKPITVDSIVTDLDGALKAYFRELDGATLADIVGPPVDRKRAGAGIVIPIRNGGRPAAPARKTTRKVRG